MPMRDESHRSNAYHFIVNPAAGNGRTTRIWPHLLNQLRRKKVDFNWTSTTSPGEATAIAAKVSEDHIAVCVGGDDTLGEIIDGLPPGRIVGIIPTGLRCDFVRTIGTSRSPMTALNQLLSGEMRWIDLPQVNGHSFLRVATIGPISYGHPFSPEGSGRRRYLNPFSLFLSLSRERPGRLSIDLDGHHSEGDALLLAVGNCKHIGGGFKICPKARFDDGLLDVVIAGRLSKLQLMAAVTRLRWGQHILSRHIHHAKGHRLVVEGPEGNTIIADGEVVGTLPATFTIKQRAFQVVVPHGTWLPGKVVSIRQRFVETATTTGEQ